MKPAPFALLVWILGAALAACNLTAPSPSDPGALSTSAAKTVEAVLSPAASPAASQPAVPNTSAPPSPAASPSAAQDCAENTSITSWTRDGIAYEHQEVDRPLAAGTAFIMSWVVQNSGTCVWNDGYRMVFRSGERLTQADSLPVMPVGYEVRPGESLTITVQMTAPSAPGEYESSFSLADAAGENALNVGVLTTVGTPSSGKLSAPGDLRYTYDCTTGVVDITLIWLDKAANEDGYRVYRDGVKLADLPAASTTYDDIVPASGTYLYTVASFNLGGESPANVQVQTSNCK
ncbi:MAG: NBR1-Ig-like domain-containing protein [Anaerolineales bacterium]|nr:MAG: NBR1-Ig-like domain-containing protein [Anaerolineales bacterium]